MGILEDQVLEEEVKQRLLALGEDKQNEKREAVAIFNNKVRGLLEDSLVLMHDQNSIVIKFSMVFMQGYL